MKLRQPAPSRVLAHQLGWVCRLDGQKSSCIEVGEGLLDELEVALVKQLLVC